MVCTEVDEQRLGQLLIFALGGAARRLFDDLDTSERQTGVDLLDGNGGFYHISVAELILRVLEHRFPVHQEAGVLRIGFDFFNFTPRRDERPEV